MEKEKNNHSQEPSGIRIWRKPEAMAWMSLILDCDIKGGDCKKSTTQTDQEPKIHDETYSTILMQYNSLATFLGTG